MKTRRNLLAAFANSAWAAVVGLAAVPFYLHFLGVEAFGLIGFFAALQAILQTLDLGLSPTLNREVARLAAVGRTAEARPMLHTFSVVSWSVAALIGIAVALLASFVASHWLGESSLGHEHVTRAVQLMGLAIACRWPIGIYQNVLGGVQRLDVASRINMVMVTVAAGGAVAVLALVASTIEAFFVWQATAAAVHAAWLRRAAWQALGSEPGLRFEWSRVQGVWRFASAMAGVSLSALVISQLDKVLLSKLLPLADFGMYVLATTVVGSIYLLVSPVFNVAAPLFSSLVAQGRDEELASVYRDGMRALATAVSSVAIVLALSATALVALWTRNGEVAAKVGPVVSLMVIGTAMHGVMFLPYALQLARGRAGLSLATNMVLMAVTIPVTWALATRYGLLGGALAWVILHAIYLVLGTAVTRRFRLVELGAARLWADFGGPFLVAACVGWLGHLALSAMAQAGPVLVVTVAAAFALLSLFLGTVLFPAPRAGILALYKNRNLQT